jgi:NAD+ synthase (glutamine-hydrolysing)
MTSIPEPRRPRVPQLSELPFDSIYKQGFARVAVATPAVTIASPAANVAEILRIGREAASNRAVLAVYPELGLSAYSNDDLFQQDALLDASLQALAALVEASHDIALTFAVGLPLRADDRLFNCAVLLRRGQLLGAVPKTFLPNYREFYEKRQFAPSSQALSTTIRLLGQAVPFGTKLLFEATNVPGFVLGLEVCEDVWAPLPPSTYAALAGATVIANLSASDVTVGKADYRRLLCASQSAKCVAGYLYSAAGPGESTTDLAWDGDALIYENGARLAESQRFPLQGGFITGDIDLDHLRQERMRWTTFGDCVQAHKADLDGFRRIAFELDVPADRVRLQRKIERFPYVPSDPARRDERCAEVYDIQVDALRQRLAATGIKKVVIGISGGLDSTQTALVAVRAFDRLGLPRRNILGYTLPGFGTSRETFDNAHELMRALGISAAEIDIRPSAALMLQNLGHPAAQGEPVYDITYENVQAGERTSHLFRLANQHGALVLGTGDLSELALGFTTYGVGDHMSHYNVNASVPKTLIRHLIRWLIGARSFDPATAAVLGRIVATPISPELVPGAGDKPEQSSEAVVGPYELQDFHLYYISRFGYRPSKVAYLAHCAWGDATAGPWPDTVPVAERRSYDLPTITRWLEVFLRRFFQGSQFKRSAMPNGPKVGSGGSLSPRGDWRAPSDSPATAWLDELHANIPASARPRPPAGPRPARRR